MIGVKLTVLHWFYFELSTCVHWPASYCALTLVLTQCRTAGMFVQVLGRNPAYWKDPERFDPSRFFPEGEWCSTAPRNAWIPFGLGPRSCIGGQLALLEMRVGIAAILQKFELVPVKDGKPNSINPDGSLEVAYDVTMAFPEGLRIAARAL
eukprot:scaffold346049_cov48-Prasinocladus_malaysianus.AAC.1